MAVWRVLERGAHDQRQQLSACHRHVSLKQPLLLRLEPFCNRFPHVQWSTALYTTIHCGTQLDHALLLGPLPQFFLQCSFISLDMFFIWTGGGYICSFFLKENNSLFYLMEKYFYVIFFLENEWQWLIFIYYYKFFKITF